MRHGGVGRPAGEVITLVYAEWAEENAEVSFVNCVFPPPQE